MAIKGNIFLKNK